MNSPSKLSLRHAETLSIIALVLHVVFGFLTLWISNVALSQALRVESWHFFGGTLIWLLLLIQFRQRRMAEEERFDAEQYLKLRQEGKDTSLFEGATDGSSLRLAERRLNWIEKFLVPVFGVLLAAYLLAMAYVMYRFLMSPELAPLAGKEQLLKTASYFAGFSIASFLFSRYAVGMSQQADWRPLRAGGSYLFSNALVCFLVVIVLLLAYSGRTQFDRYLAFVIVILMAIIGLETLLNLVLDAYRPRIQGQYRRAAFESRLLGLFCEPTGLLRSAAHAIDYQFGFKVSETWFFRLLSQAIVPLIILQALILYFMSCFAIVEPGSVGVLERLGKPLNIEQPLQSGMHLKLPWPIDKVRQFPVEHVQIIEVGFEREANASEEKPILWTEKHWAAEFPFMVAVAERDSELTNAPAAEGSSDAAAQGTERNVFDLLVIALVVQYRIDDVASYGYGDNAHINPRDYLESICYRETLHYAAQSDLLQLMGPGRDVTTEHLLNAIQSQADQVGLGVKIVFVGLESVHPPLEVAESFEEVVAALQEKQAEVLRAQGEAGEVLEYAHGDREILLEEAKAYKTERTATALAEAERFEKQVVAFEKGADVYLEREYLSVLDEMLPQMRKYVVASDRVDRWVYEVDLKEKLQPDLFTDLGISDQENEQ